VSRGKNQFIIFVLFPVFYFPQIEKSCADKKGRRQEKSLFFFWFRSTCVKQVWKKKKMLFLEKWCFFFF